MKRIPSTGQHRSFELVKINRVAELQRGGGGYNNSSGHADFLDSVFKMGCQHKWFSLTVTQGFGAGLFWYGSGSGNLQPGAGSW